MKKDYKTIREVVGPLMMVDCVENVKYDELVEIHEKDGSVRLGKALTVCRYPIPRRVFWATVSSSPCRPI